MSILPLKAPGLFRKIMVEEYDFYTPLTIGFGLAEKVQKQQQELFAAKHPEIENPTEEQVKHFLNSEGGSRDLLLILAEYLLLPGEHGISAKEIVDYIDINILTELMDFFTQSVNGKVKSYKDFKASSREIENPEVVESTTNDTSRKDTGQTSTRTSRPKGSRGK